MDQPELTFEDSLKQVMQTLPPAIRTYLVEGRYTVVAKNLMAKYGLRIDQGGVLEREIMLLLMGVEDPTEFTQTLADEARLSKETVTGIAQDVNEQIFMPLRAEEMKSGGMAATPAPSAPRAPAAPVLGGQPQKFFHLENKIPTTPPASPAPAPLPSAPSLPPVSAAPQPAHIAPLPPKVVLPPRPATAFARPSMDASLLLEDHEEPHLELNRIPASRSVPPNLPGAMPPSPAAPAPQPKPAAPAPIKAYGADPYREPIDEPPV